MPGHSWERGREGQIGGAATEEALCAGAAKNVHCVPLDLPGRGAQCREPRLAAFKQRL